MRKDGDYLRDERRKSLRMVMGCEARQFHNRSERLVASQMGRD